MFNVDMQNVMDMNEIEDDAGRSETFENIEQESKSEYSSIA